MHARPWSLACDAQNRDRVGRSAVQARHHIGACRARSADAHADIAGLGAGVTLGHVRGAFHVASKYVIDAADLLQGRVQRIDGGARDTECGIDTFATHHQNGGFDCSHFAHCFVPLTFCNCIQVAVERVYSSSTMQVNGFYRISDCRVASPVFRLWRRYLIFRQLKIVYKVHLYCVLLLVSGAPFEVCRRLSITR